MKSLVYLSNYSLIKTYSLICYTCNSMLLYGLISKPLDNFHHMGKFRIFQRIV